MNPYESPQTVSNPMEVDWKRLDVVCFFSAMAFNFVGVMVNMFLLHADVCRWSWYYDELHWWAIPFPLAGGLCLIASGFAKRRSTP